MQQLQKGGVQSVGNVRDSQGGGDGLLVEFVEGFLDYPAFLKRRQAIHHAIAGEGLLFRCKNVRHRLHPQFNQDAVTLMSVEDDVVVVLGKTSSGSISPTARMLARIRWYSRLLILRSCRGRKGSSAFSNDLMFSKTSFENHLPCFAPSRLLSSRLTDDTEPYLGRTPHRRGCCWPTCMALLPGRRDGAFLI